MISLIETPLNGEPDAGNPPVRFGGRGEVLTLIPTSIRIVTERSSSAAQLLGGQRLGGRLTFCPSEFQKYCMNIQQLRAQVRNGAIDTVIVAFPDPFGRLVGKRFRAEVFLESVLKHGTHGCNYLL